MKVVYIAGKFRGANAWEVHINCIAAELVASYVADLGAMPLCPHMNTRNMDGTISDQFWLDGTMELLRRLRRDDALITVDNWQDSEGARGEVEEAQRLGIPVFHDLEDLEEYLEEN
jgi:hypothetical protein